MISKKLLSEVLGCKVDYIIGFETKYVIYHSEMGSESISYYELAYKCKEWALTINKACFISSWTESDNFKKGKSELGIEGTNDFKRFSERTELEAIFKACEWILKNKA